MPAHPKLTPEQKVALCMKMLRRKCTVNEICKEFGISHASAYEIRDAFIRAGKDHFQGSMSAASRLRRVEKLLGCQSE